MLILLQALIQLFLDILRGMVVPLSLAAVGAVAVAALLRLATFPWKPRGIKTLLMYWFGLNLFPIMLLGGIGCAFIYSVLIYLVPALKGGLTIFLISLPTGIIFRFTHKSLAPTNKAFRWRTFYAAWVYCWLAATIGLRYGMTGILLITLPALFLAGLVLFFVAGFILPYPELAVEGAPVPAGLAATFGEEIKAFFALMFRPDYLLNVELDLQSDLEECCLSDKFRQKFKDHGITLSDNITIESKKESGLWQIRDIDRDQKYIVRKIAKTLNVYCPENKKTRKKWFKQRREALRCLLTYAMGTNYPYHVVIDEKIQERTEDDRTWLPWKDKLIKRLDGDAFGDFLAGPGIVLTGCDQAVVLSTGLKFKGAKGPGVVFTGMSDNLTHVIDLRVQLRAFPVTARTKDGIAVRVFTFTPFRMGRGKDEPKLGKGFPYRTSDVFKAIQAQMVEHKDPSQVPENLESHEWYDLPKVIGERAVREAISQYNFDDLYAPFELHTDPSQHPRSKIDKALQKALEQELPKIGLQRVGSGISNLEPEDPRVIEQRIEAWTADWKRKIMLQQAAGQSRRLQLVEQARAQAQVDVIVDIGKRLDALRDDDGLVRMDDVALGCIKVLEGLAQRAAKHGMLPPGDTENVAQGVRGKIKRPV